MAAELDLSYPTIRNLLQDVIHAMGQAWKAGSTCRGCDPGISITGFLSREPVLVNVNEVQGGERVQVDIR